MGFIAFTCDLLVQLLFTSRKLSALFLNDVLTRELLLERLSTSDIFLTILIKEVTHLNAELLDQLRFTLHLLSALFDEVIHHLSDGRIERTASRGLASTQNLIATCLVIGLDVQTNRCFHVVHLASQSGLMTLVITHALFPDPSLDKGFTFLLVLIGEHSILLLRNLAQISKSLCLITIDLGHGLGPPVIGVFVNAHLRRDLISRT